MRNYLVGSCCALALLAGCKTADSAMDGVKSAGSAAANGVTGVATSLVNVNLSNVLNDLALDLKIDKANIPINAQIPISVAANVCGVSINILSIGGGSPSKGCTANTASPELVQAVQQQLAAEGSVGGGAQSNGGTTTSRPAPTPSPTPTTNARTSQAPATGVTSPTSGYRSNQGSPAPSVGSAPVPRATPTPQS